ncbi:hypothetical protein KR018_002571 [Drosophila ironensis]|nr:hypothetical protein KR018_002571 [Drosophila ironensis]
MSHTLVLQIWALLFPYIAVYGQPRVIGGQIITSDALGGYIVGLRYDDEFICGGTLIENDMVVSAAHCFENRDEINLWTGRAGVSTLKDVGTEAHVREIVRHKDFDMIRMDKDIAVVLFNKSLVGDRIKKLALCSVPLKINDMLVVAGWGAIKRFGKEPINELRSAIVPVVDRRYCETVYSRYATMTTNMFCAGVLAKRDTCMYDSGGPAVLNNELCGIISFGMDCASPRYPGIYTDINALKSFIQETVKQLEAKRTK